MLSVGSLFGERLLEKGYVDHSQIEEALELQKVKRGRRLGGLLQQP